MSNSRDIQTFGESFCPSCVQRIQSEHLTEIGKRLLVSVVFTCPVIFISMGHMIGMRIPIPSELRNYLLLLLSAPVQFWAGWIFHRNLAHAVRTRRADMDTLITIATFAAYLYSLFVTFAPSWIFHAGRTDVYYDTSAMIITIVIFGRYLEARTNKGIWESIQGLFSLYPPDALLLREGKEVLVPHHEIREGDLIRVRAGDRIPADGVVLEGSSLVDESMLTGESMPVGKAPGEQVIGGTINRTGTFLMQAQQVGQKGVLANIMRIVTYLQAQRPRIQRLADRVAAVFVPCIIAVSLVTFIVWSGDAFTKGLLNAIAVLMVACPCALGLATPIAVTLSAARSAKEGILIRHAEVIERLPQIEAMVFDKTGTLTDGKIKVSDVKNLSSYSDEELLALVSCVERGSDHPIAAAILQRCNQTPGYLCKDFEVRPGGVIAKVNGKKVVVGNLKLMQQEGISTGLFRPREDLPAIYVAIDGEPSGIISFSDTVYPGAKAVIEVLASKGIKSYMITGDLPGPALSVSREVGIPEQNTFAGLLPQEKVTKVSELKRQHRLAMVGDGINDAPALAQADVGIAIGTGSEIAMHSAGITLMGQGIYRLPRLLDICRLTMQVIRQNLCWAFGYNLALIPIAAGLLSRWGIILTPEMAAVAMALSSLTVVGNSLRVGIRERA